MANKTILEDYFENPIKDDWFYDVLEIDNPYSTTNPRRELYRYILDGNISSKLNIAEFGVFRGKSLITLALCMKIARLNGVVFGFDSFYGFPQKALAAEDDPEYFDRLHKEGLIDTDHKKSVDIYKSVIMKTRNTENLTAINMSTSKDFAGTSIEVIQRKLDTMGLNNVKLVAGPFEETIENFDFEQNPIGAINLDADLYSSYKLVLTNLHKMTRKTEGAFVFLDEYYSLKFPGPRKAVVEFLKNDKSFILQRLSSPQTAFERWAITKS